MSLIRELQRRNVFRVALGYLASAWLLIQILETLFPIFGLAETSIRVVVVILAIGFVPVVVLSWVFEWTPEGIRRDIGSSDLPDQKSSGTFDRAVTVILVLALGYFAVDKFVFEPDRRAELAREARQEGRIEAVLDQYEDKSIVVLPFVNLSSDEEQAYFADGLTEELLNLLAKMPELRVISRSTAFTFKGKEVVVPEVARKLNVSHVLEGSVRKAGNQIRVTVQLIEGPTDTHLWSETYDRQLDDIFTIQDEVSQHVVNALALQLLAGTPEAEQIDPEAYELFLQTNYLMESGSTDDMEEIRRNYRRVLELEPEYLPAWAGLARAYYRTWQPEDLGRTREIVSTMAEIDPDSSWSNHFQGWIAFQWDRDYVASARFYERAIADDPFTPPELLRIVARLLVRLGRIEEGIAVAKFNLSRDPACTHCAGTLARHLTAAGRPAEAVRFIKETLEWQAPSPNTYWNLGVILLTAGEPGEAMKYFEELNEFDPRQAQFAQMLALSDLVTEAEFETKLAEYQAEGEYHPEGMARIYAWAGNADKAFEWIERWIEQEGSNEIHFITGDLYMKLRPDPRYQALIEKYDLATDDLSYVEFNPPWPPALQDAIDRLRPNLEP